MNRPVSLAVAHESLLVSDFVVLAAARPFAAPK